MRIICTSIFIALLGACTQPRAEQTAGQVEPVQPKPSHVSPATPADVREAFTATEIERMMELIAAAQREQDLNVELPSMQIRPPLRMTPHGSDAMQQQMLERLEAIMSELQAEQELPQESGSGMR